MKLELLSAAELGRLVNRRELSPTEAVLYFRDRIERRNPSLNAFVYTKFEDAAKEAEALERRLLSHEETGPLAGVPIALKDFLPSKKGWTNSHGGVKSLIQEDPEDSVFYTAARNAGAIALGKTNAPAFAFRGTTDNFLYGPTSTPFKPGCNSGGSSGGSAAAVADGMILIGEGSDGGGSIRIPASWCGCYGFKASVGTIPSVNRPDGWAASHPYCFNGAITKTVEDSAIMLEYMQGYDPRDPHSAYREKRRFTELMKRPIKGWRIGYTDDFGIFTVDPEVKRIVRKAAERFTEAGAFVEPVSFGFRHSQNDYAELWCRSICFDTATDMELWKDKGFDIVRDHRDELPEEFIYWNDVMLHSTILDLREINEMKTEILDVQENVFRDYDLILSPVTVCPPVKNRTDGNTKGPMELLGKPVEPLIGFCETFFENFTGNPAASIPAGLTDEGLPVGMQIIGRKFMDEDVLAASRAFEELAPWSYDIPLGRAI
ncbi:MAG: amidase [Lachnospiraceae bacterium]|nr:amidase [Lachnospiraceae bacterium]